VHKFFAKTLFLGKKVLFLPECHSSNDYLSNLNKTDRIPEGTVVWTDFQTQGKGQRGNQWESKAGENLLASTLVKVKWLPIAKQYMLSFMVGIAIREVLGDMIPDKVYVKWPNDIFINNRKIGGILCETSLSGYTMDTAVIGFGINVNQTHFDFSEATSLHLETQQTQDREQLLENVLLAIEKWYHVLHAGKFDHIMSEYIENLLGFNEKKVFYAEGEFLGRIVGIDEKGHLKVEIIDSHHSHLPNGAVITFGLKEIRMLH
jgi:BirA family biotin operon repressor/biotin-[acetyl-CoA-carboxylase] ligase